MNHYKEKQESTPLATTLLLPQAQSVPQAYALLVD
jgi:hypothetical protein